MAVARMMVLWEGAQADSDAGRFHDAILGFERARSLLAAEEVAAPAAVANAISNAIGAPMRSMPFTPDKVLAALAAARKNK